MNATYQTPVPFRACDSLMLRHWLDTGAALKGLDNIREQNVRKFSQATSFGSPDIAGECVVCFSLRRLYFWLDQIY